MFTNKTLGAWSDIAFDISKRFGIKKRTIGGAFELFQTLQMLSVAILLSRVSRLIRSGSLSENILSAL